MLTEKGDLVRKTFYVFYYIFWSEVAKNGIYVLALKLKYPIGGGSKDFQMMPGLKHQFIYFLTAGLMLSLKQAKPDSQSH